MYLALCFTKQKVKKIFKVVTINAWVHSFMYNNGHIFGGLLCRARVGS